MGQLKNLPEEQKDLTLDWIEDNVLNHPEYGREAKRLLKKIDKRANFPEVDLEDIVQAKTQEQEEKINKFLQDQKDKDNKAYWEGERKRALDAGLVKPEETKDFEKWMIDEHLGNYDRAARMWHDEKHASAEPTNYQDVTGISLPSDEGLFGNPIKWARDTSYKMINEMKRSRQQ